MGASKEVKLLKKCVKGDPAAFEAIVAKYQVLVCAITYSGTADFHQSEDLAHQTFLDAWKNLSQLRDPGKFRSWLCSIARNNTRSFRRKKQHDIISSAAAVEDIDIAVEGKSDPLESAIQKEHEELVNRAILEIPEKYREPLVLYYLQQKSTRDVAELLDLSEAAVRQQLHRGREMIKSQVSSIVEDTLSRSCPKEAFTAAVMGSIAAFGVKSSTAAAMGVTGWLSKAGVSAVLNSAAGKAIIATAAAIAIGAVVTYTQINKDSQGAGPGAAITIAEQQDESSQEPVRQDQGDGIDDLSEPLAESVVTEDAAVEVSEAAGLPEAQIVTEEGGEAVPEEVKPIAGIGGVVVDKTTSRPIKNVQLYIIREQGSVFTDSKGQFKLTNLAPIRQQYIHVIAKGYVTRKIIFDVVKDKFYEDFKIELLPGGGVIGIVVDEQDNPIKGATVKTFQFTNQPVVTGGDGEFEIDGLDPAFGRYGLHTTHPDHPAVSVEFTPPGAGETVIQDVVLKPGVSVYGKVTDSEGLAVAGATIGNTTSRAMWNCLEATSDSKGEYRLDNVSSGALVLWAKGSGFAPYVERFSLDGKKSEQQIDIQLGDSVDIHGWIVDKEGNGIKDVYVGIREYKGVSGLTDWQDRVLSDGEGRFVLPNVPSEGTVTLSVFAEFIPNTYPEIDPSEDEEHVITVDMAGRLYGMVVDDSNDQAVQRFTVKMTSSKKSSNPRWGYSASWNRQGHEFDSPEGYFDTGKENIPIGAEYSITVLADGFDPLTIDPVGVQTISNDPDRMVFRLKGATFITGTVLDENNMPIEGATVRNFSETNRLESGEHYGSDDIAITNKKGQFKLGGVAEGRSGIYVRCEGYGPYLEILWFPEDVEKLKHIVLDQGAEVFGRVTDNGKAVSNATVRCYIFQDELRNRKMGYLSISSVVDYEGYYELLDLPAGRLWISFESRSRTMSASRNVELKGGEEREVNFGDEEGFTVSGSVRAGSEYLKNARVSINVGDRDMSVATDEKGLFELRGIKKGQYRVHTSYRESEASISSRPKYLRDNQQIDVEGDMEIEIDFGIGSIEGVVPQVYVGKVLRVTVRRLIDGTSNKFAISQKWEHGGIAKIESDGSFVCSNLRAGWYYLLLSMDNQTVRVSEVLELGESQQLTGVEFDLGSGELQIEIVDSESGNGIGGAMFVVKNEWDAVFVRKELTDKDNIYRMVTDDRGRAKYPGLVSGSFIVLAEAKGFVPIESEPVTVSNKKVSSIKVSMQRGGAVRFALDPAVEKQIIAERVYLVCKVIDLETGEAVSRPNIYGTLNEHIFWLGQNKASSIKSRINLAAGSYRVEYGLSQDPKVSYIYWMNEPELEGVAEFELSKGETMTITVSKPL